MSMRGLWARLPFLLILAVYAGLGLLYAVKTPMWQTPDEPAHFNYVAFVAEHWRLPVLQAGDYPAQYLEDIKAARFPPSMSVEPLRYESHQPPLYYLCAAIVYRLTAPLSSASRLLILRLFSVALGIALLCAAFRVVGEVFPGDASLALHATAFIALIPMHLALTAAINNDTLAELLLMCILWQCLAALRSGPEKPLPYRIGVLLGLAMLAKTTIYLPAAGVVMACVLLRARTRRFPANGVDRQALLRAAGRDLLPAVLPPIIMSGPWLLRNAVTYGRLDVLAWTRHALVVSGQLRTTQRLAEVGALRLAREFLQTTFNSFWAQFGWMGVPADARMYVVLALFTGLVVSGAIVFYLRSRSDPASADLRPHQAIQLLWLSALLTVATYAGYNLSFLQPQGRYLFPALGPLAVAVALGLREVLRPSMARKLTGLALFLSVSLFVSSFLGRSAPRFGLALAACMSLVFAVAGWMPSRWRWLPSLTLFALFVVLNLVCVFRYIVPYLS